jgi:hypothetical protein
VTWLSAKERHRACRFDGDTHDRAGCAADAARQVDSDDRFFDRIDRIDHCRRPAHNFAIKASAEERIDNAVATANRVRRCIVYRTRPSPCGHCGVAGKTLCIADEVDRDIAPAFRQQAGCNKTITAVIAWAGHNAHTTRIAQAADRVGDGTSGTFHEVSPGQSASDRQAIRRRHFGSREQFNHRASLSAVVSPYNSTRHARPGALIVWLKSSHFA